MGKRIKVAIIAREWIGANGVIPLWHSYREAFKSRGDELFLDPSVVLEKYFKNKYVRGIVFKILKKRPLAFSFNRWLLKELDGIRDFQPDLVCFCNGFYLYPWTLEVLRKKLGVPVFHLFPDDLFDMSSSTPWVIQSLPLYDCIFTAAKYSIGKIKKAGAREVKYLPFAFDPRLHYRVNITEGEKRVFGSEVSFIGTFYPNRADLLEELVRKNPSIKIAIWGNNWEKLPSGSALRPYCKFVSPDQEDSLKIIGSSKIMLGLSTSFQTGGSIHVMRTFEIPASGGFMLAQEAGDEYESFFERGKELITFRNADDLAEKINYYLKNEKERKAIAESAFNKVQSGSYTYGDRVGDILQYYKEISGSPGSHSGL